MGSLLHYAWSPLTGGASVKPEAALAAAAGAVELAAPSVYSLPTETDSNPVDCRRVSSQRSASNR